MKKINIKPFSVKVRGADGTEKEVSYALKESMVEILFNPALKLNSLKLLKQEDLARKIINANGDDLLVEDEEYSRIKSAFETVEGLGKNDVELVHRITDAQTVEVETKAS